jgi:hypothetical protein
VKRLCGFIAVWTAILWASQVLAQNAYTEKLYQFLSFGAIPTWTVVATDWNKEQAQLHLYDSHKYKGHAQYISVGLKTGITFAQFKEQVRYPAKRKYMPFFLFDLRKKPLVIDGKTYTWALRIEDYAYQDNAAQMTETTLRLLRAVTAYIRTATGNTTNGIIVLATNLESQPNVGIAPALNQAGYPNRTVNQLLTLMGGKAVHVLNPGTGYGYLRYVPAGEEANFRATGQDIVVYARMPARVPPVNGIITLEPQTPLSHVNLLAKNRGTLNLYATDTASLPGLHAQIGKLIKMACTDQRITIQPATEQQARSYWEAHVTKVVIPAAITSEVDVLDLAKVDPPRLTANLVGAKAANYGRLQHLLPAHVKPGLAIPFFYYQNCIQQAGVDAMITNLVTNLPGLGAADIEGRLAEIRKAIQASRLAPSLLDAVQQVARDHFPGKRIRLRSSTNCEDLPGFNGAGLYLSKGVDPGESNAKLAQKILEIYASLWTPTAFAEREYYGIDHNQAMMAVLINEAYSDEYANGVVLTIPDKTGYAIAINTQWGDSAVTNPESGQVPEAILFKSALSDVFTTESRSSIHDIFLENHLAHLLLKLKALTMQIHQEFTAMYPHDTKTVYGVDIEFKIVQEPHQFKLYIKQARPLGQVLPE